MCVSQRSERDIVLVSAKLHFAGILKAVKGQAMSFQPGMRDELCYDPC